MNEMRKRIYDGLDVFHKERWSISCFIMDKFLWARMLKKLKVSFMVKHSKHIKRCRFAKGTNVLSRRKVIK